MTELQQYQADAMAITPAEPGSVVALRDWAQAAHAAHSVAQSLVKTSFVPEAFRGKPDEATAAILSGAEVGLSPMAALRSYDVIQGTAAPRAMTLRAIVQSRGHKIWVVESTDQRAIVRGRRVDDDEVQESTWDIARAKGLGLLGKHNWKAQQKAMLIARATAECCRLIASDAILGIPYAAEELDGGEPEPQPAKRTAQRRTTTRAAATVDRPAPAAPREIEAAPAPPLPDDEPPGELEPPHDAAQGDREPITKPQSAKLHAMFNEAGIKDRDTRLRISAQLVKRPLASSSDLTKDEASELIDTLDQLAKEGPLGEMIAALLDTGEESQLRDDDPDLFAGDES